MVRLHGSTFIVSEQQGSATRVVTYIENLVPPPTPLQTDDYLAPATLARLGAFELRARMIVEGIRPGMHASLRLLIRVRREPHRYV